MITVIAAVIEGTLYSITFKKLKYQFRINEEVLFEDTNYLTVRAEWGAATKY
jgi:hypothetical protein